MIEESARVVSVDGARLVLEAEIKTTCQICTAKKGCGTSLLAEHVGRKMTRFQIKNTLDASVGDEIIVGLSEQAMFEARCWSTFSPVEYDPGGATGRCRAGRLVQDCRVIC